jgi:5-methylcytosine-specific restriction endonuclease McrA
LNGPHLRENVQIAHPGCNLSKGNRINETDDKIIRARKLLAERGCADVSVPALAGAGQ